MIITPVLVTRGLLFDRGFTFRKNTIIHCFHGSYSSRGLLFRYPITIEDYPRQGVGAARSAARTRPLNGTPTSILWNGDDDRRRHLHTRQALALLLREPRSKEKPLAGACSLQAHSDAGRFPKRVLGRKSQSSALWNNYPAHTSVDGLQFGSSPH